MRWSSVPGSAYRAWRAAHQAVRSRGGVLPVARAAMGVIRRQGLGGVRSLLSRAARTDDYGAWIARFDTIDEASRASLRDKVAQLKGRPRISIVVPVFNPRAEHLRDMLESVLAQIYPDWELCLCDDASTEPHVAEILAQYAAADTRIKTMRRDVNGHICVASNDALALATGDYVALLDHDDRLAEHALYLIARYLQLHPQAKLLYSDEDKLTPDGERIEPYFKPDWDPILMLGQNMFSHLGVISTALVREVGGFRAGFEGSQDHDLVLRCAEEVDASAIVHIPHVLYHWRISEQSTAREVAAKPYVREAAKRAVKEHLERTGRIADVDWLRPTSSMLRVVFPVQQPQPLVSVIIPTRDKPDLLAQCIDSLSQRTRYANIEILIVDNGSTDARALALLSAYDAKENCRVIRDDSPFNYSALNNRAAALARGAVLCLLNNDIESRDPEWLSILCGYAMQPGIGAVGCALWYPNERLQHGGVALAGDDVAGHLHHMLGRDEAGYFGRALLAQQVSAVTGACLVVRKALFEQVGGLDEENLGIAYNDIDFCLKLNMEGYRNVYVPYANLYHHESASRGADRTGERAARLNREAAWMRQRWGKRLVSDPAYNPNLEIDGGQFFRLSESPRIGQFD
ncbi:glycosyltransferase involved in cell wall biosynthesis [Paraburkholderia bannensis]|uniref:Glycosyltransferase involved in cell wall biosynthesis n=1 Tax=Paraburkholderia bannensis TaxID=765414 RepID=A0A7W9WT64_9BURK|nr:MULTISPECIES: glycosyltransferase [Paraburkholderia]MBB3258019.1 glycosyltransferase involved in cell wall biosynthesis [Paraburkholderia sp. WP4_3_2]MBB6103032.1 glycosyltransferase involved in cell wall biosynthesis [Paraburkholderia bannensis]